MRDVLGERAKAGTVEATATSAYSLNSTAKKELERLVASNYKEPIKVILEEERDPAVVGGVKLVAGELQLDLTVHGRLKNLTGLQQERNQI
jgi:F0F1-type ATP synthase delta subunit